MSEDIQDDLNRLSDLYEGGELKTEEYELLKSRILDDVPSAETSRRESGESTGSDSLQEAVQFDIVKEFWDIVPEDKYDNSLQQIDLEDKSTDDISIIMVSYSPDEGGFSYYCIFHERAHEERMFELLEGDKWELVSDSSDDSMNPSVMVRRKAGQGGFRDELSSEYVDEEVSKFLELVQTVYRTDLSNLVKNN